MRDGYYRRGKIDLIERNMLRIDDDALSLFRWIYIEWRL